MDRVSGPVWMLGFVVVGLAWTFVSQFNHKEPAPNPTQDSQVSQVIKFCLNPDHQNSRLCVIKNPQSTDDLAPLVVGPTPSQPVPTVIDRTQTRSPAVIRETETRTIVERQQSSSSPQTSQPVQKQPQAPPRAQPQKPEVREVKIPVPVKLPVKVPDVEVPKVAKIKIDDSGDILSTSKD